MLLPHRDWLTDDELREIQTDYGRLARSLAMLIVRTREILYRAEERHEDAERIKNLRDYLNSLTAHGVELGVLRVEGNDLYIEKAYVHA